MLYKIIVPGKPVAKDRPRINKSGKMYTTLKTKNYEELVYLKTREVVPEPLKGNVKVGIHIYAKALKSDIDNVIKSILDGMTGAAYENDRQVKTLYAEVTESQFERVEIDISEKEERRKNNVSGSF
jgi:Holliday junction resolvase RusA-like endonuclease